MFYYNIEFFKTSTQHSISHLLHVIYNWIFLYMLHHIAMVIKDDCFDFNKIVILFGSDLFLFCN